MSESDERVSWIMHKSEERTLPYLFLRYVATLVGSWFWSKLSSSASIRGIAALVDTRWLELIWRIARCLLPWVEVISGRGRPSASIMCFIWSKREWSTYCDFGYEIEPMADMWYCVGSTVLQVSLGGCFRLSERYRRWHRHWIAPVRKSDRWFLYDGLLFRPLFQ